METLNIDAASFHQMESASGGREEDIARLVKQTVEQRGKQHNPVTGSGGMLLGTVRSVGADSPLGLTVGDRVATLISLTLTPCLGTDSWRRAKRALRCQSRKRSEQRPLVQPGRTRDADRARCSDSVSGFSLILGLRMKPARSGDLHSLVIALR